MCVISVFCCQRGRGGCLGARAPKWVHWWGTLRTWTRESPHDISKDMTRVFGTDFPRFRNWTVGVCCITGKHSSSIPVTVTVWLRLLFSESMWRVVKLATSCSSLATPPPRLSWSNELPRPPSPTSPDPTPHASELKVKPVTKRGKESTSINEYYSKLEFLRKKRSPYHIWSTSTTKRSFWTVRINNCIWEINRVWCRP